MKLIHRATLFAVTILVLLPSLAWSDTVGPLNTFNAGETARASEVNDNFDAVESAVDGNDTLITDHEGRIVVLENDVGVPGPEGPQGVQGVQGAEGAEGPAGAGVSEFRKTVFVTSQTFDGNLGGIAKVFGDTIL